MIDRRLLCCTAAMVVASCATSADQQPKPVSALGADQTTVASVGRVPIPASRIDPAVIARFAPTPESSQTINYALIDEALDLMVFNAGPSLRRRQRLPDALSGTRFVRGHTSPYRLEGNKVFFSQFDDEVKDAITEYRQSLETIAASGRVLTLPRREQLAFWYNLHNFIVIDEIGRAYPVRVPRKMSVAPGGETFQTAPIVTFGDDVLSLRDLREIVYTHWSDPKVMYGFYLGDLGGPSIRQSAYTGASVSDDLDRQAREFVNSLRGVGRGNGTLLVSAFYEEGRSHFFTDWPTDLQSHLADYADEEVAELLADDRTVKYGQYQDRVADMAGGDTFSDLGARGAGGTGSSIPPSMLRMVTEYREKLQEMREEGYFAPKIIIIDVPTDDPAEEGGEVD